MDCKTRLFTALLISSPSLLFAADTLVFAVDIIRHGDRTPITPLASVDYQWKEGLGQLTAEGMQQEYRLGVSFRKNYMEKAHLLSEQYEYGRVYVRSTDYHRTLMSAESLLAGLYPHGTGPYPAGDSEPALPYGYQPVPVFTAPAKYDDVILQQISTEERHRLYETYVYSTPAWQQKDNELKDKYPRWSQLTGVNIRHLNDLQSLGDTLFIHQVHNAPLPSGLSQADIKTITDAGRWAFMAHLRPQPVAAAFSGKMMNHIASYLQSGSQSETRLKYVLLSAHDTTIATALSYLEAPLDSPPPYASNVNFSLYQQDSGEFTVKVTYNGNPVFIPGCNSYSCELQQFMELVKRLDSATMLPT